MKKLSVLILVLLAGCTSNEPIGQPTAPPTTRHPRTELPPTTPAPEKTEPEAFEAHDYDIAGKWRKDCTPVTGSSIRQELSFLGDRLLIQTETFSDSACTARVKSETLDLVFEDGWDPIYPQVNGTFVKGWKGIFRDETDRSHFVDYNMVATVSMENGKLVLYLHWTTEKTAELDLAHDRFVPAE